MAAPTLASLRILWIFAPLAALVAGCWPASAGSSQQPDDRQTLVRASAVERRLNADQIHSYDLALAAGDYVHLIIEQRGIAVTPRLFTGDRTAITDAFFSHLADGPIAVSMIAESGGIYRLEIEAQGASGTTGGYRLELAEQRPATAEDRGRLTAEKAFKEGERLKQRPTSEERLSGIAKLEEAAAAWHQIGDRKGEARALTAIGAGYEFGGDLQGASAYYQRAILLAQSTGNRLSEANLHLGLGRIQFTFGDKQAALDSIYRSAQLFRESSARYGEALALSSIGTTYFSLNELPRALEYHQRALPIISSMGDWGNECISLNHIGDIHLGMGEAQKALAAYERGLVLARRLENSQLEARTLGKLGNLRASLGDERQALDFYTRALKLAQVGGFRLNEAILHRSIGDLALLTGEREKAFDSLSKALRQFRAIRSRAEEAGTLYSLARVNSSTGNLLEARQQIEAALDIKESLRAPLVDRNLRVSSVASIQNFYSLYINLLMQLHRRYPGEGYEGLALKASESARARGLLELLVESGAEIREGASAELLALERTLQRQLNAKAAARTKAGDQLQAASFDKEISQLTARYHEVEAQIRATSPRYAALTQPQPLSAAEIQQLLDEDSVLLEYSLGEEQSWLWVLTPGTITSHPLPPRAEIESAAARVYHLLTTRQPKAGLTEAEQTARIKEADARFQVEAASLSRTLLGQIAGPLRTQLQGKRLLIVASGGLEYLPFAALPLPANDSSYRPLITEHETINLPSASVLSVIRRESGGRAMAAKTLAVLADPVFDANDPRLTMLTRRKAKPRGGSRHSRSGAEVQPVVSGRPDDQPLRRAMRSLDRGSFSRLPFSGEEADAIASLVPAPSLLKATDFQASRATALSGELSRYRIIHFATHGLLNSANPELSGLVLSLIDEDGRPQDGFLRMHEIYNLRLSAEVVVLSACQTGLGKEIRGEGLIGLTRGFMYAGAQRVVASLWQVDDSATAELMKRFYRGMLKDGRRPASALRAAQLEMLRQKPWSSPYYWAPFVMQGEWK
jgi:CHAT domain-containing protein